MIVKELFAKLGLNVDGSGFEKAEALFTGLKISAAALGLGLAGIAGALAFLGKKTAETGIEAERAAARMGITTDAVQELEFAAGATGVATGALETALFRMSRAAYEAKHGSTEAAEAFHGLLTGNDLKNGTPDQMLEKLANGFLNIKDKGERAEKIMKLFGRGGKEIIPLLEEGSAGIAKLREQAHELGFVLDKDAIAQSKEFIRNEYVLEARLRGLRNVIGNVVIRGLLQFRAWMEKSVDSIKKFYNAHAETIFQTIKLAIMGMAAAAITYAIAQGIATTAATVGWAASALAAARAGAAMMWAGIRAIAPWIPMGLAVLGLIVVLEDLYGFFTGKKSVIGDFISDIKYIVSEMIDWRDLVKDIILYTEQLFGMKSGEAMLPGAQGYMGANGAGTNAAGAAVQYVQTGMTNAGTAVYSPRPINTTAHITVNTQATDPKAVASAVKDAIQEHHDKTKRETYEGIQ